MWICGRCGERNPEPEASCPVCAGVRAGQSDPLSCESCGAPVSAGNRRCEACERAMADAPTSPLTKVWSCADPVKAELMRVLLERVGIAAVVMKDWGVHYGYGLGNHVITVPEPHAARAVDLLKAEWNAPPAETYIPPVAMIKFPCGCGKELEVPPDFKGLEMDCPYCGKPVRAGSPGET